MNPWHDIPLGDRPEEEFRAIIEIPRGSRSKYEIDKESGLLRLDRVLYSAVFYPTNYGFLPQTYCDDGDPLDVWVYCQENLVPLCVVPARPIGVIPMSDEKGEDKKIIAVCTVDPEYDRIRDVADLPPHRLRELKQFLLDYKTLERKKVDVDDLRPRAEAVAAIRDAVDLYRREIAPGSAPHRRQ
ncbi:MAG: inorganic diphosphatase [Planctomycetes bacterium]|nr:inorganic diphosphatase [Planctomycetota bacterium]